MPLVRKRTIQPIGRSRARAPAPNPAPRGELKLLSELPARITRKIELGPDPDPGSIVPPETRCCWLWTGAFTPPRTRVRKYRVPENETYVRNFFAHRQTDRGLPIMHSPELGYPTSAVRVVYAQAIGMSVRDVPALIRCTEDRCVSPHHVVPSSRAKPKARVVEAPALPDTATASAEDLRRSVLDRLKHARPGSFLSPASAAEEAGLAPELVTPEIWMAYLEWDEQQEE